jgi:hypothetical protein
MGVFRFRDHAQRLITRRHHRQVAKARAQQRSNTPRTERKTGFAGIHASTLF